jgi:hypothetical protein
MKTGKYQHYKGSFYNVLGVAKHSETEEEYVVYQALYGDHGLWLRPKAMFCENVTIDGQEVPRFNFVDKEITKHTTAQRNCKQNKAADGAD